MLKKRGFRTLHVFFSFAIFNEAIQSLIRIGKAQSVSSSSSQSKAGYRNLHRLLCFDKKLRAQKLLVKCFFGEARFSSEVVLLHWRGHIADRMPMSKRNLPFKQLRIKVPSFQSIQIYLPFLLLW